MKENTNEMPDEQLDEVSGGRRPVVSVPGQTEAHKCEICANPGDPALCDPNEPGLYFCSKYCKKLYYDYKEKKLRL